MPLSGEIHSNTCYSVVSYFFPLTNIIFDVFIPVTTHENDLMTHDVTTLLGETPKPPPPLTSPTLKEQTKHQYWVKDKKPHWARSWNFLGKEQRVKQLLTPCGEISGWSWSEDLAPLVSLSSWNNASLSCKSPSIPPVRSVGLGLVLSLQNETHPQKASRKQGGA